MNPSWYLHRFRRMSFGEIAKRLREELTARAWALQYGKGVPIDYRTLGRNFRLAYAGLPGKTMEPHWTRYRIFNETFDLTRPPDWLRAEKGNRWPDLFYRRINCRTGNPYGDIRLNWELNRLQFLPGMALTDKVLARRTVEDWLDKNRFLHGPAYLSAMEVALRWISIYRAACWMRESMDDVLRERLAGLAAGSGLYIRNHLSTHSSAGNHLIVEAVGLFWIGRALGESESGKRWIPLGRRILWREILRQLNPDGTGKEQTFWYLGFVLDALLHYLLLEDRKTVPRPVWRRIESAFEFIHQAVLPNGLFPDYGDRDDGFVLRIGGDYEEPYFLGLLAAAGVLFQREEWRLRGSGHSPRAKYFYPPNERPPEEPIPSRGKAGRCLPHANGPAVKTFPDGGLTVMTNGRGRIFFKHGNLGLAPTFGHGHADALSLIFYWDGTPVLIDPGTGQYNGDRRIREYFRSTVAHNTIAMADQNQAEALGPFLWKRTYTARLEACRTAPSFFCEASHTGYERKFGAVHTRRIQWPDEKRILLTDFLPSPQAVRCRGAFHLPCRHVDRREDWIAAVFEGFSLVIGFKPGMNPVIRCGEEDPFLGWVSRIYGQWETLFSILYDFDDSLEASVSLRIES